MKKLVGLFVLILLLVGCSSDFEGDWVLTDKDEGCLRELSFYKDNKFSIIHGNGDPSSGEYKKLEDDNFSLDVGFTSIPFEIKQVDDQLKVKEKGDSDYCTYKRK
ncbi:hypothetical protein GXN76_00815 [Kroppenstedtia pulmonis]|uniref:Lipoprotein n=1 Tax=Kroppenstedtia pulmonis TaxID=1380685 RepID=A0A7D3XZM1_9BACL|nr:hypothetical protein [Kroppenstedtia pulmonis]QKG83143.1 hypothetical protein GXN76_00815 [Kroppenstedtia pulmonis]